MVSGRRVKRRTKRKRRRMGGKGEEEESVKWKEQGGCCAKDESESGRYESDVRRALCVGDAMHDAVMYMFWCFVVLILFSFLSLWTEREGEEEEEDGDEGERRRKEITQSTERWWFLSRIRRHRHRRHLRSSGFARGCQCTSG